MTGIDRITRTFEGRKPLKLMAHAVCGYPDLRLSRCILGEIAASGVDFIEAQLPFSEPSADGPMIVEANHVALRGGASTEACMDLLGELRSLTDLPILIMSYLNPLLAYGIDRIIARMVDAGLDGLIVPDFPDDEPEPALNVSCAAAELALVPLTAPTTSLERAGSLAVASPSPFIYAVLRLGVTGRKTELDSGTRAMLAGLKERTGKYVAAGFGLRDSEQLSAIRGSADCAIVGSAVLAAIKAALEVGADPSAAAGTFLRSLQSGC